jgi:hypothetical protein
MRVSVLLERICVLFLSLPDDQSVPQCLENGPWREAVFG